MIKVVYINSMSEVLELLTISTYDKEIKRYRSSFLYRGLPNVNYKLESSLKRNCKHKQNELEKSILRNFAKYAATDDSELLNSVWRQLIIGQHHGLPTRLLDWTYSPLVSLHFATSGEDISRMNENDCVLWEIDIDELNELLPAKYKKILKDENAHLFTTDMLKKFDLDQYDLDMSDRSLVLIEPPSIDQRIINQYSYFSVIPKDITNFEEFLDNKTNNTTKYIISKDLKWEIRDMLDGMNMNERIFFPGLDGLSQWIKRHYYVK